LFVAAAEERKNLATLIAAHARAFPGDAVALVVAGGAPPRGTRATWLGVLDPPALATWYRAATLVAVPSYYEGFGFPLLEAMACGRAVLASRAASLPEVGADGCSWIDGPLDVRAWADGLQSLMSDDRERERLERAALARAQTFSWDRCAEETLSVFRAAAASR
jgi:glycosyltransferase involved in cell wall biosynthesis